MICRYFFQMEKYKDDRSRTLFIYYSEEGIFLDYVRLSSRVHRIFNKVGRNAFKIFDHFFHTVNKTLSLFCIGFKRNSLVFGYERNKLFSFFRCYSRQLQVKVKNNKGRERKTWRCIYAPMMAKRSFKDRVRTY